MRCLSCALVDRAGRSFSYWLFENRWHPVDSSKIIKFDPLATLTGRIRLCVVWCLFWRCWGPFLPLRCPMLKTRTRIRVTAAITSVDRPKLTKIGAATAAPNFSTKRRRENAKFHPPPCVASPTFFGAFLLYATFSGGQAKAVQSCSLPITAISTTLRAEIDTLSETVTINDVT